MKSLELEVRFLRHGTDAGTPCEEQYLERIERRWRLPAAEAALVLVDCWAEHFIASHASAGGRIMRETLAPAVEAARQAGLAVIHAPSPTYVEHYPQWLAYAGDAELFPQPSPADEWPPGEFRRREGEYAVFARPVEPRVREWVRDASHYRIDAALAPHPADFVVKSGEQLHRLLRHQRRVHLFYAGFATNICVLFRDYGTRAMWQRGYNIILLRDGTIGIEHRETVEGQWLTRAAIDHVELSLGASTTAAELIRACREVTAP